MIRARLNFVQECSGRFRTALGMEGKGQARTPSQRLARGMGQGRGVAGIEYSRGKG